MPKDSDARVWLRTAGFDDLADRIDLIMESWRKRGLKTRRNWWEALAGTPRGMPMTVEGVQFPIISAVRHRLGLDPVKGAVDLPPTVVVPPQVQQVRWQPKRPKRRTRRS
jgi:hypothetical protein